MDLCDSIITHDQDSKDRNVRLQALILFIAKEIKRICEKNNIEYFLSGGTLLGAVRHKGFIPWDDDFDIGMSRANYEKFINACEKDLNTDVFVLQTWKNEEKYCFDFAKIQLKGTSIIEDFSKNVAINHGIFVDIFPFDNLPDKSLDRKIFMMVNHVLKNMIWVKCGYGKESHKKKVSYKFFSLLAAPFDLFKLKEFRNKWVKRYNHLVTKENFYSDYPGYPRNAEWFTASKLYQFEDTEFLGVADADALLKASYGDYMKLPPIEKRVQHSHYEIDFGNYFD